MNGLLTEQHEVLVDSHVENFQLLVNHKQRPDTTEKWFLEFGGENPPKAFFK